jgi:predicted DNA-binding protein (MmcQ/YjbR family)
VAVFKVAGKMFAVVSLDDEPGRLTVKCEPDYASFLVQTHDEIVPGYHMNKRHWVTVTLTSTMSPELISELISDSHELIVASLPAQLRRALSPQPGEGLARA